MSTALASALENFSTSDIDALTGICLPSRLSPQAHLIASLVTVSSPFCATMFISLLLVAAPFNVTLLTLSAVISKRGRVDIATEAFDASEVVSIVTRLASSPLLMPAYSFKSFALSSVAPLATSILLLRVTLFTAFDTTSTPNTAFCLICELTTLLMLSYVAKVILPPLNLESSATVIALSKFAVVKVFIRLPPMLLQFTLLAAFCKLVSVLAS